MSEANGSLITRALIDELQPSLLRSARRILSPGDAEDVVQLTWISALRAAPTYEGRASLSTWIHSILRRRIYDHLRRRRLFDPCPDIVDPAFRINAPERADLSVAVQSLLGSLPELNSAERTAIELVDLEGEERDAVADRMHVSRGHLRVLLFRGRDKLVRRLAHQGLHADQLWARRAVSS